MRVLLVSADFPSARDPQTGVFILRRAQTLASLGHDVFVLRPLPLAPPIGAKWKAYASIPEYETIGGIPVHTVRVPMPPRMIGAEYLPLLLRAPLEHEIARVGAQIAHASYLVPAGQLVVRQERVPSIVTTHGFDSYDIPYRRPGLRRATIEAASKATRVTAVAGYLATCVRQLVDRPVDVIWNGADERFFYPRDRAQCRAELGLPADRTIVAYAGYLITDKGVYELVDAIARIPQAERPLLVLAGDGAARAELEAKAAALGIDVRFLGAIAHERIADLFGAADVVTLPSYVEGLPNVVCEAMLSERAVVASTAGGIPEIVHHERTGLLVAPKDVQQLADALARVCGDHLLRERLARAAREFAAANLTWRISAARYVRLYEEVLEAWPASRTTIPTRTRYAS